MTDAILALDSVTKTFGHGSGAVHAARAISFSLHAGRALALVGESGSGKTTCARMAMREYLPTSGRILYKGRPVEAAKSAEIARYRRSVQMIFQDPFASLNPVLRIETQFYDMLRTHKGMSRAAARERTAEMLTLVDIAPDRMRDYPHQFSGGMRQRIVIAICMALDPKLVVMDEPTTALDVVVQREILQRINELRRSFGFSVLFITHDLGLMVQFCDRIGIMLAGQLVEQNTAEAIYRTPKHDYTKKLWASFPSLHGGVLL